MKTKRNRLLLGWAGGIVACVIGLWLTRVLVEFLVFRAGRWGSWSPMSPPGLMFLGAFQVAGGAWILGACLRKAGIAVRVSTWALLLITSIALLIGSAYWSEPLYRSFLNGFAQRVAADLNHQAATQWAQSIFSDTGLNRRKDSIVRLKPDQVPSWFDALFDGWRPDGIVYYSQSSFAETVYVAVGEGFARWGVAIFRDGPTPMNDSFDYIPVGKGIWAFHSNR